MSNATCKICKKTVSSKGNLSIHLKHRHPKCILCSISNCLYHSNDINDLLNHIKISHSRVQIYATCEICKLPFDYKMHYDRHILKHKEKNNKRKKEIENNKLNKKSKIIEKTEEEIILLPIDRGDVTVKLSFYGREKEVTVFLKNNQLFMKIS